MARLYSAVPRQAGGSGGRISTRGGDRRNPLETVTISCAVPGSDRRVLRAGEEPPGCHATSAVDEDHVREAEVLISASSAFSASITASAFSDALS